ncbi:MAG TPA: ELWxxDGT repeat protein [Parafilimonas sp.]|nr:ELWxxDGT repeat protein [Parafilimonas sp.]
MNTKFHFLLSVIALSIFATTVKAQNAATGKFSVQNIPFGKKLPPPDLTVNQSAFMQKMPAENMLASFMPQQRMSHQNAMGKSPEYYRQLFLERKKMLTSLSSQNTSAYANNAINGNSDIMFNLTKDIDSLAESYPKNLSYYSDNTSYAVLNDVAYFAADDGIHGIELWRSDGTSNGTYLVKDINPGLPSGNPLNITAVKGKVYFTTSGAAWVSDGTNAGTQIIANVYDAGGFFARGNKVDFIADGDFSFFGAVWETDGTAANTKRIIDIGDEGDGGEQISQPTTVNGTLFFTFFNYTSFYWELWKSDGTDAGTHQLATNTIFPLDPPLQLTNYNGKLYFSADVGTGRKLWSSDGTDAGTMQVQNDHGLLIDLSYAATFFGYNINPFPVLNNVLYLSGSTLSGRPGLYKYDPSNNEGVTLVKYIAPNGDTASIVSSETHVVHNKLYFKVTNNTGGLHDELWSSQGTSASTQIVDKAMPGESISKLYDGHGTLYFVKSSKIFGSELWKVVDAPFGSFPIIESDVFPGQPSSNPNYLTSFKGKLLFGATDAKKGTELFLTNDLGVGATLVKDINTVATSSSYAGFNFYNYLGFYSMAALGDNILFNAYENIHGFELYRSDGTTSGTQLLNDIVSGESSDTIHEMVSKNNTVYFIAQNNGYYSIYKSNGTKASLKKLTPDFISIQNLSVADNGLVFYTVYNTNTFTYQLWRTDGTSAGNYLLSSALNSTNYINAVGNVAFFTGGDNTRGYELWKSDGTVSGTVLVKDINPGAGNSSPAGMFIYKHQVFFAAYDGVNHGFWKSDGTSAGTKMVKNIDPWYGSSVQSSSRYFCVSNNILYFSAIDYSSGKGTEIYRTDGSSGGTKVVKDISPNDTSYYPVPQLYTDVNGTVFFEGNDDVNGNELWETDGTASGTKMVDNITPGSGSSNLNGFTSFGGKLYFQNAEVKPGDNFSRYYLWSSDGTAEGTQEVGTFGISNIAAILAAGDNLFLDVYTQQLGNELYVGKQNTEGKFVASNVIDASATKEAAFNAVVFPNPAKNVINIQLTSQKSNNVSLSVIDISGKTILTKSTLLSNGEAVVQIDVSHLSSGSYFIKITGADGSEKYFSKFLKE